MIHAEYTQRTNSPVVSSVISQIDIQMYIVNPIYHDNNLCFVSRTYLFVFGNFVRGNK